MKRQEKDLFKALCSFKAKEFDESLLKAAKPIVLGHLFYNRMQAIAYGVLREHDLLGKVNREFRNSLKLAYDQNVKKNKTFFNCVTHLEKTVSKCGCKYAMLKGAYLCKAYPEGYRTSNDIDLLVNHRDVTVIGNALLADGFKQGSIRNEIFIPATRREIIESKMMRGETVPYIKEINLPDMKFLEVDINFSLDYMPNENILLDDMLKNTVVIDTGNFKVRTLKEDDFFIHLCVHLYKEATTLPWVEMGRDMSLYKYSDIYMILNDMSEERVDALFERAEKTGSSKICAFAVMQVSELFNFSNNYAAKKSKEILCTDPDFVHTVISPKDKKIYVYTEKNIEKRFFFSERRNILKEV